MFDLTGKIFLITGATSGIGASVAEILSSEGARLILSGRNKERLKAQILSLPECVDIPVDISCQEECEDLLQQACSIWGPLDGMVHCAGISLMQPMRFYCKADFMQVIESNLGSAFHLMSAFRKRGRHAPESHVIMISSIMGQHGMPSLAAYSASKAGLEGAVRVWAVELAREGIRVNALAPGYVTTPMFERMRSCFASTTLSQIEARHPLGLGQPEDVAHGVAFMLSPASRWIPGVVLPVAGGFHAG